MAKVTPIFSKESHPLTSLISKYNTSGPRYTSYPTALQFSEDFAHQSLVDSIRGLSENHPISIYIHIPFCQSICFYCACNKVITKHKDKAIIYLEYLKKELSLYAAHVGERPIKQIHFGGGTPNFLKSEQLDELMAYIHGNFNIESTDELDLSIEIDPRYADASYLENLRDTGFNRLSFGIQDLNFEVQTAINRVCSYEHIEYLMESARELNYGSIHMDLIYGLPHQTPQSFRTTIAKITELRPDRLSMFNYAHLPHRFPPQRRIKLADLPSAEDKLNILHNSIDNLEVQGYRYIGMDHFALKDSPLAQLQQEQNLHRNFQGYTTHGECALIATGVSGISQVSDTYSQNFRRIDEYYASLDNGKLPIWRGYQMHKDDRIRHSLIMQLICHGKLDISNFEKQWDIQFTDYFAKEYPSIIQQQEEGLLNISSKGLAVTELGFLLIRNICMVFDAYMSKSQSGNKFSQAI